MQGLNTILQKKAERKAAPKGCLKSYSVTVKVMEDAAKLLK